MAEQFRGDFSAPGYGHRYDPRYWSRSHGSGGPSDMSPERAAARGEYDEWGPPIAQPVDPTEGWSAYIGAGSPIKRKHAGRGPQRFQRSDRLITEDVSEVLMRSPDLEATDIEVHAKDGIVKLSGSVPMKWMKRIAESLALSVFGVKDVDNHLRVSDQGIDDIKSAAT